MTKKIKNIILDLDLTLISSIPIDEISPVETILKHETMKKYFKIFSRPYLQYFLDYIFENYSVSVWTAASKDYAMFIIKTFILDNHPNRHLDYVFFSYHCSESEKHTGYSKKIDFLNKICKIRKFKDDTTLIIDDNHEVYNSQPNMCYLIKQFDCLNAECVHDKELIYLIDVLKQKNK